MFLENAVKVFPDATIAESIIRANMALHLDFPAGETS